MSLARVIDLKGDMLSLVLSLIVNNSEKKKFKPYIATLIFS